MAYDRLVIRNLGSRNGVRVNGLAIEESLIKAGDEIAIAQFLYRCETLVVAPQVPRPANLSLPPSFETDDDFIPLDD